MTLSQQDWQIRTNIYSSWVNRGQPLGLADLSEKFDLSRDETQQTLERLHEAHHIFLDPDSRELRMANPLSAIETNYRVKAGDNWLFANCAWDTLGIAAMIGDAIEIQAKPPLSDG